MDDGDDWQEYWNGITNPDYPEAVATVEPWFDNGDGSWTGSDGTIVDYTGTVVGYENWDGSWTDLGGTIYTAGNEVLGTDNGDGTWNDTNGHVFDNDNNLIGSENGDGTWTDLQGNVYTDDGQQIAVLNPDNSYTDAAGRTIYANGTIELPDGSWLLSDGTTYRAPDMSYGKSTLDKLLEWAGAGDKKIGGNVGNSTSPISFGGGSGSSGGSQQNNTAIQQAIAALERLAGQAQTATQRAAITAAQTRLGVGSGSATSSTATNLMIAAAVALGVFALTRQDAA